MLCAWPHFILYEVIHASIKNRIVEFNIPNYLDQSDSSLSNIRK